MKEKIKDTAVVIIVMLILIEATALPVQLSHLLHF